MTTQFKNDDANNNNDNSRVSKIQLYLIIYIM